jgi:hypothetical protein
LFNAEALAIGEFWAKAFAADAEDAEGYWSQQLKVLRDLAG